MIEPVARYLDRWQLVLHGVPFETSSSWFAYVECDGAPAVLKVPKPESEERLNAAALAHYGDAVAVKILRCDRHAYVMERAVPGTELSALSLAGRDDEATHIACDIFKNLHTRAAAPGEWKSLNDLANGFSRYRNGPSHPLLDREIVDRAEATFRSLCATQVGPPLLLHGDLHHMNILRDEKRGWRVIDPKGVVGELAYEPASVLHNPIPHFEMIANPATVERRVRIFSDRLGLSENRILRWCFAKNILGHLWTVEDGQDTSNFPRSLKVAETALMLLGE